MAHSQSEDDLFNDDVTYVDEFAQTRAPDDLFDDDFTPVSPETVVQPAAPPTVPIPSGPRGRGNHFIPRGGRGRGRGASDFRAASNRVPTQSDAPIKAANDSEPASPAPVQDRAASVRGDRTLTGGVQKPKLSEEELTKRMQQISLKNNSLLAAHARAEADAASFAEREARNAVQAAQRRQVDRVNRQQMMGEREKNRRRKLDALGGREWDMEKKEDDYNGKDSVRGSANRRGMHGGVGGTIRNDNSSNDREQSTFDSGENFRGRGRGGRGRYGPRRGGIQRDNANKTNEQTPPTDADFPELPPGEKPPDSGPASKLSLPRNSKDGTDSKERSVNQDTEKIQTNGETDQANGTKSDAEITKTGPRKTFDQGNELNSPTEGQRSWADQVEAAGS